MAQPSLETADTYTNPVYAGSFPDPFVLKFADEYYAYCTGHAADGRVFGVLQSRDLVNWTALPGAMQPLDSDAPFYWAPEVTYYNGTFYLYYSVGNEVNMELRVAVSDRPGGGFVDSGHKMTHEEFAIDAHVFVDDDQRRWMFYATDFLEHTHIGTGTVVDLMIDPFTLAGSPRPVTRAKYDWQVYDPVRKEKGNVRWHTIEGAFILKRKGKYFEMFSGGNWQNVSYGVSYAVTDNIERDEEWRQHSDGDATLPILRTIPDRIIGPGHNSVVLGPNNRDLYCVYHRWVGGERVLAIDRMDFSGPESLFINGPTDTPQRIPLQPAVNVDEQLRSTLTNGGQGKWLENNGEFTSTKERDELEVFTAGNSYLLNVNVRSVSAKDDGTYGIALRLTGNEVFGLRFSIAEHAVLCEWPNSGGPRKFPLPEDFDFTSFHHVELEVDRFTVNARVDGGLAAFTAILPAPVMHAALVSGGAFAAFRGFTITKGFQELFDSGDLEKRGWDTFANRGKIIDNGTTALLEASAGQVASLGKKVPDEDFECCLNMRIAGLNEPAGTVIFACQTTFTIADSTGWHIQADERRLEMPAGYDPGQFHQYRLVRRRGDIDIFVDADHLGTVPAGGRQVVDVAVMNGAIELDMIRYTVL